MEKPWDGGSNPPGAMRMKALIGIGMAILFISVFLIQMTFEGLVRAEVGCIVSTGFIEGCDTKIAMNSFFGIMFISFFVFIDIGTWYLIFINLLKKKREPYL